jgi:hypothetical protein
MSDMQPHDPYAPRPPAPPGEPTLSREPVPAAQPWGQVQPAWQPQALMTDRRDPGAAVVVTAWVLTVLTLGYFLPWAIAATRGRSNQAAIGLIDLLLGWTLIGWIAALVMACQAHAVVGMGGHAMVVVAQQFPQAQFSGPVPQPTVGPGPGWYPSPSGPGQQYWDGSAWTEHRAP